MKHQRAGNALRADRKLRPRSEKNPSPCRRTGARYFARSGGQWREDSCYVIILSILSIRLAISSISARSSFFAVSAIFSPNSGFVGRGVSLLKYVLRYSLTMLIKSLENFFDVLNFLISSEPQSSPSTLGQLKLIHSQINWS